MFKKLICIPLIIFIIIIQFSSCSKAEESGSIISYALGSQPQNLDPALCNDNASLIIIQNTYEGLMTFDKGGKLTPGAASSFEVSADGLTYTFVLRGNLLWSDKTPLTAKDFVFGFERLFNPLTKSPLVYSLFCIKNAREISEGKLPLSTLGVKANGNTVIFTLVYPMPFFPELTASSAAMPCNEAFFISTKGKYGVEAETILSNGPFSINKWTQGEKLTLIRNKNYYDVKNTKPKMITLTLKKNTDKNVDYLKNDYTHAAKLTFDELSLLNDKDFDQKSFENSVWLLCFNMDIPAFQNINIRKGLFLSIDNKAYINKLPSNLKIADRIVPPAINMVDKPYFQASGNLNFYITNASLAREAFFAGLKELSIERLPKTAIICPKSSEHSNLIPYIQQIWQRDLGAFINLDIIEDADYYSRINSSNFQMALIPLKAEYNSPESILLKFGTGSSYNVEKYSSKTFDNLINASKSIVDLSQRTATLKQAEQTIISEFIVYPLYFETEYYVNTNELKNIVFSPFGGNVYFKFASLK